MGKGGTSRLGVGCGVWLDGLDAIKLSFQLINIVPQNVMLLLNGDDPNCAECRRDLAPAGASAAKKRYRGSFQQWEIRWDSREAARTARSIGVQ